MDDWRKHKRIRNQVCPYCGQIMKNKRKHFAECSERPHGFHGHSEETKHLISEKRKAFLEQHPDEHPWRKHKNEKFISKPCEYLKTQLRNKGIEFKEEVIIPELDRNFSIDIFIPKIKLGIEVNGNQHYDNTGNLTKYYQERHDLIESTGIKLLELHYANCYKDETIELLWRNWNLNCLLNSKICEFESRQQYNFIEAKTLKAKKEKEHAEKIETARKNGQLSCDGRISPNKIPNEKWSHWKDMILRTGVDLTKFGWVSEVVKLTGLSKKQIRNTVRRFNIECFERQ